MHRFHPDRFLCVRWLCSEAIARWLHRSWRVISFRRHRRYIDLFASVPARFLYTRCLIRKISDVYISCDSDMRRWILIIFWQVCLSESRHLKASIVFHSGGDPGGFEGSKDPHFPEWGSHIRLWPPSFDAMLMSLFSLYILVMDRDSCRWSSSALI